MLRFDVFHHGAPATDIDLGGAYVFGEEAIPLRADLAAADGQISCIKRVPGACGLALLWDVGPAGRYLMPTTHVPERRKPYNLNVELVRAQASRMARKQEEWGLFDYADATRLNEEFARVRRRFVDCLKASDPAAAAQQADEALVEAVTLGERIALFHADILLERRKAAPAGARGASFGAIVDLLSRADGYYERLREAFDFLSIPLPWKRTEPRERVHEYDEVDAWIAWAARDRKPVHAGPLLSFDPAHLPEWLYIWEHDYEALRDVIYEHVQHVVKRYHRQVRVWKVVSGLNAFNSFDLAFEQLMELTRMCCLLVKRLAPRSAVVIELLAPWGEYYARNQRTIPPMLYADMAVQSGIKFDAFGLQVYMGVAEDGYYVRDLLQLSAMLDEFMGLGKPLHVTACQVPSDVTADAWDAWGGKASIPDAGHWHQPWSQRLQAEWLQAFYRIAISKPFVESICWRDLADYEGHFVPHGGLCRNDLEPKLAFRELRNFRAALSGLGESDGAGARDADRP
jgi:hypothetical protein